MKTDSVAINQFWNWFSSNSVRLRAYERNDEDLLNEVSYELSKFNPGLGFEIGPIEDSPRAFIISADGIRDLFPAVLALTDAAPKMDDWDIIAFRPCSGVFDIDIGTYKLHAKDCWFTAALNGSVIDLTLFLPDIGGPRDKSVAAAAYILLDTVIGEYDVVTKIRGLERRPLPQNPIAAGLHHIEELPEVVDSL